MTSHPHREVRFSRAVATSLALAALITLTACSRPAASTNGASGSDSSTATAQPTVPEKALPALKYRAVPATADDDVLTYHNDLARTGLDPDETILTPANVNASSFGKLFSDPVDGFVYAQPLYVSGVSIPGKGTHNIIYVATENDTVYAFDADQAGMPLWRANLLEGGSPVSSTAVGCGQIVPRIGITGTPVIDRATGTLYVVAMVQHTESGHATYAQRLHALDIATGAEKPGGPVTIAGSVAGKGAGSVKGKLTFDAFSHLNRPGLALANGTLYIAFGSHCDLGDYHGWVFAYSAAHLRFQAVFNATPNGSEGAIWEAGDAPAVDGKGNVFVLTGNGTFDAASGGSDYGDSFVKLAGNTLRPLDFFTPYDEKTLDQQDLDIGSGGALLLPDQTGPHPHLVVGAGKNSVLYVVDRDHMGRFNSTGDQQIVQAIRGEISGNFSTPAYWNGRLYIGSVGQPLKAFAVTGNGLSAKPVSETPDSFNYPGTTPAISSNGNKNAIVWGLDTGGYVSGGSAILRAYDATDLTHELYSNAHMARGGPGVKFTTPTIAHGMVYFGTQNSLEIYGLQKH
jgi:outer membrane protein assembly factor BamB